MPITKLRPRVQIQKDAAGYFVMINGNRYRPRKKKAGQTTQFKVGQHLSSATNPSESFVRLWCRGKSNARHKHEIWDLDKQAPAEEKRLLFCDSLVLTEAGLKFLRSGEPLPEDPCVIFQLSDTILPDDYVPPSQLYDQILLSAPSTGITLFDMLRRLRQRWPDTPISQVYRAMTTLLLSFSIGDPDGKE